jgi:succinate dehydrogenase / fumarate reductase cytochrome b subunit
MNWIVGSLSTSVGKKQLMAVTGIMFLLFLTVHLIGNLTIYGGATTFNAYSEHLHALGVLLTVSELGLLLVALIHIFTGLTLFLENRKARPVRYAVDKSGGGRTWSSVTMPYTGLLILLFIGLHLATVSRFVMDKAGRSSFQVLTEVFSHTGLAALYLGAMLVVALHVRHGLWSAFQTVGANHPKYMPCIQRLSIIFAILVGVGFGSLPIIIRVMK